MLGNNNLISPTYGYTSSPSAGAGIWLIIALVLSIVGCFVVYFLFVNKKDTPKKGFLGWLKAFLDFDKMLIEPILKISYIFVALFITLGSFAAIDTSFFLFLGWLIIGNLVARLLYEGSLMFVMLWKNTAEIKNKLK